VIAAAKIAEAHDFVMQLPKAMRIVGERGQKYLVGNGSGLQSHAQF